MGFFGDTFGSVFSFIDENKANNRIKDANSANAGLQKEFAKNSIQWKVADAKKAGIHPLYALGAQTSAASPSFVAGDTSSSMRDMGQDISRALDSTQNSAQKQSNRLQLSIAQADLEGKHIDNAIRAAQLAKLNQAGTGIPLPTGAVDGIAASLLGQPDGNALLPPPVELKSMERTRSDPNRPSKEAGDVTDYGYARTPTGLAVVPSSDVKNRIEDAMIPETMWSLRNNLIPNLTPKTHAPDSRLYPPPKGMYWKWNTLGQEYRLAPIKDLQKRKPLDFIRQMRGNW